MPAALLLASEGGFTVTGPHVITSFELFGMTWNLTETVFIQWIVMLVLLVVMLILTHKMEVIPKTKRQAAAEWLVTFVRNMVDTTMGPKYKGYTTYIGALLCFLLPLCSSLTRCFACSRPAIASSPKGCAAGSASRLFDIFSTMSAGTAESAPSAAWHSPESLSAAAAISSGEESFSMP